MKKALLIVDVQNDFLPGGACGVKNGNHIILVIHKLLSKKWDAIVASKDWHPKEHVSFASTHQKKIGEIIKPNNVEQILWPVHCVQNSWGAEFPQKLDTTKKKKFFTKELIEVLMVTAPFLIMNIVDQLN